MKIINHAGNVNREAIVSEKSRHHFWREPLSAESAACNLETFSAQ
jgi:hypothetical protein